MRTKPSHWTKIVHKPNETKEAFLLLEMSDESPDPTLFRTENIRAEKRKHRR